MTHLRHSVGRAAARLALAMVLALGSIPFTPAAPALAAPVNDDFTNALVISAPTFTHSVDTTTATPDAGESASMTSCRQSGFPTGNTFSVWYTFQAASDGWATIDDLSSTPGTYDTVLEVWESGAAVTTVAGLPSASLLCADDSGKAPQNKSEMIFKITAGRYYYVMVRDYAPGAGGNLVLKASITPTQQVYVDGANGDDSSGSGSVNMPFKTIQRGINAVEAGGTVHVAAGAYAQAVIINKSLTLVGAGNPTAASFTLTNGARLGAGSGGLTAPVVNVNQTGAAGARLADGVLLAAGGGSVTAAAGVYTDTATITKTLRLIGLAGATLDTGAGTTALTLNAGAALSMTGFSLQNAATGVRVNSGSHSLSGVNFLSMTSAALTNAGAGVVTADHNYWGSASGPTEAGNPGGVGQTVSGAVYGPWCTVAAPACTPLAGVATRLVFSTSPSNTQAGFLFAPQPVVRAEDALGNLGINFQGLVSLAIRPGSGAPGAVLSGTTSLSATLGVADFAGRGLGLNLVGRSYVLSATAAGLSAGLSAAFDITGSALRFQVSPGDTPANAALTPSPVVQVEDGLGGVDTSYSGWLTVTLIGGSAGAVLTGSTSVQATNGVATFSNLLVNRIGQGYQLRVSAPGLVVTDSAPFNITADRLVFLASPNNTAAGAPLTPNAVVSATDGFGATDTTFTGTVTLAIRSGTGAPGALLSGTLSLAASAGQATFGGLAIGQAGAGYQLQADSGVLQVGYSTPFSITAGGAAYLIFTTSPAGARANQAFDALVEARDVFGNRALAFNSPVSLSIQSGPAGALLAGVTTVSASQGLVTYTNLALDHIGQNYQLAALAANLAVTHSAAFTITADRLFWLASPADAVAGATLTTVVISATDGFGSSDPTFNGSVSFSWANNAGGNGTLSGSFPAAALAGAASFSDLSIDKAGVGYVLSAASGVLLPAASAPFTITHAAPVKLAFATEPGNGVAGAALAQQPVVLVLDRFDNLAATYSGLITATLILTPSAGALQSGQASVAAVGGVVTYTNLAYNKSGQYQLQVNGAGLTGANSALFRIDPAAAAVLVFGTQPADSATLVPLPTQPVVRAEDPYGNLDTNFSALITLSIVPGSGTPGATLAGLAAVNASGGLASYTNLAISKAGARYVLSATAAGLTSAASAPITISKAAAGLNLSGLTQTYNGGPQAVTSSTVPPGLQLLAAYTGTSGTLYGPTAAPPVNAGVYSVSVVVSDTDYYGQSAGRLTVYQAAASLNLGALAQTYDGTPRVATSSTVPPGLRVIITYTSASYGPSTVPPVNGGSYQVDAVISDLNYAGSWTDVLVVAKAAASVNLGGAFQTYSGQPTGVTSSTTPAGLMVVVTYTGAAGTVYGPSTIPPTSAGSYDASAAISDTNYAGAANGALTIAKANQSLSFGPLADQKYGRPPFSVTATASSGLAATYLGSGACQTSGNQVTLTGLGACTIFVLQNGDNNYNAAAPAQASFNVLLGDQSLSFGPLSDQLISASPINLTATASSGLAVAFNAAPLSVCSATGPTLTLVGAGLCTVTASQPGSSLYNAATPITQAFNVSRASQVITFAAIADKLMTDSPLALTPTASSGLTVSLNSSTPATCNAAGLNVTLVGAGVCTLIASQAGDVSWNAAAPVTQSFNISRADQSIAFAPLADRDLSQSPFNLTATASSGLAVTYQALTPACSVTGSQVTLLSAGLCTLRAAQAGSNVYNPAPDVQRSFNIGQVHRLYLPAIQRAVLRQADLVGVFRLSPANPAAGAPVQIQVVVTNRGTQAAAPFWVDFYINPATPPTTSNIPWNTQCTLTPCYGLAWYVPDVLDAGQSITLTSDPASYRATHTRWLGSFAPGTQDLYLYVDSWNPGVANGAVDETDETNNRAEMHWLAPLAGSVVSGADHLDLPPRPAP